MTPQEAQNSMYDYMINTLHLRPIVAASLLGNAMLESSFLENRTSSAGAKGFFQFKDDKLKAYKKFLATGWKDGPKTQVLFVYNYITKNPDYYYLTYDTLKERQKNNWRERTADGTGWYTKRNRLGLPVDSLDFYQKYYPRELAGTLPPRKEEIIKAWESSNDLDKLTRLFMEYFEKPEKSEAKLDLRLKYAKLFYQLYLKLGGKINYLNIFKK